MLKSNFTKVRFQVLAVVTMRMAVLLDVALCGLVDIYHCCRGTCFHHLQGLNDDRYSDLNILLNC
jgi:hypothetical protein